MSEQGIQTTDQGRANEPLQGNVEDVTGYCAKLRDRIASFRKQYDLRHKGNFWLAWLLIVLSFGATVSTSVMAIRGEDSASIAIVGLIATVLVGLNNSLAIGKRAEFQRVLVAAADTLLTDLTTAPMTEERVDSCRRRFNALTMRAAKRLPPSRMYGERLPTTAQG